MTTYKYLYKKYNKKETKKLFKIMELSKQHKVPTRGLRGSGNSTLMFCELMLGKYSMMWLLGDPIEENPDYTSTLFVTEKQEYDAIRDLIRDYRERCKG